MQGRRKGDEGGGGVGRLYIFYTKCYGRDAIRAFLIILMFPIFGVFSLIFHLSPSKQDHDQIFLDFDPSGPLNLVIN